MGCGWDYITTTPPAVTPMQPHSMPGMPREPPREASPETLSRGTKSCKVYLDGYRKGVGLATTGSPLLHHQNPNSSLCSLAAGLRDASPPGRAILSAIVCSYRNMQKPSNPTLRFPSHRAPQDPILTSHLSKQLPHARRTLRFTASPWYSMVEQTLHVASPSHLSIAFRAVLESSAKDDKRVCRV